MEMEKPFLMALNICFCWKILCDAFPEAAAGMKQGPPTRSSQKAKVPAGIPAAPTLLPGMKKGLLGLGWAVQTFL